MPEELNRVLTDHISNLLFAPTVGAVRCLKDEGIHKGVYRVGDIMVDSLEAAKKVALTESRILNNLSLRRNDYYALTIHRAANTNDPGKLIRVLSAIGGKDIPVIFPIHPRTRKVLANVHLKGKLPDNITMIDPLGYVEMVGLMASARGVLTDSGGIQKESFILGTRCITLRENTEWPETFIEGRNRLVGMDQKKISRAMDLPPLRFPPRARPFGSVGTSSRIVRVLNA
jgi:UDP-N-acetylglucosamine 2-epimerase